VTDMRVTEKLLNDNNKSKLNRREEPQTVEMYMEKAKSMEPINQRKSVYQSVYNEGINSKQSVFDAKAVFKTNSN
jgi:hypothetical protein